MPKVVDAIVEHRVRNYRLAVAQPKRGSLHLLTGQRLHHHEPHAEVCKDLRHLPCAGRAHCQRPQLACQVIRPARLPATAYLQGSSHLACAMEPRGLHWRHLRVAGAQPPSGVSKREVLLKRWTLKEPQHLLRQRFGILGSSDPTALHHLPDWRLLAKARAKRDRAVTALSLRETVARVQVQPKLGASPECSRQREGGVASDRPLRIHDLTH